MNATATLFDAGEIITRPRREAAPVKVSEIADEDVTGVAGVALVGPMLDRLNVVDVADARGLRPIGPGGYTGGECYRTLVEMLLAGGEFLADRSLLEGATEALRGQHAFPSHTTLFRFCAGADFGQGPEGGGSEPHDARPGVGDGRRPQLVGWSRSTRTPRWSTPTVRARKARRSPTGARSVCRR